MPADLFAAARAACLELLDALIHFDDVSDIIERHEAFRKLDPSYPDWQSIVGAAVGRLEQSTEQASAAVAPVRRQLARLHGIAGVGHAGPTSNCFAGLILKHAQSRLSELRALALTMPAVETEPSEDFLGCSRIVGPPFSRSSDCRLAGLLPMLETPATRQPERSRNRASDGVRAGE